MQQRPLGQIQTQANATRAQPLWCRLSLHSHRLTRVTPFDHGKTPPDCRTRAPGQSGLGEPVHWTDRVRKPLSLLRLDPVQSRPQQAGVGGGTWRRWGFTSVLDFD